MQVKNIARYFNNYIRIKKGLESPLTLIIFVSDRCNLKCRHCFWWKQKKAVKELTIEQLTKIARSVKNPLETLHLTGGEPFLRNDISEICATFAKFNSPKNIAFSSNGVMTDTIMEKMKEIGEKCEETAGYRPNLSILISLDGFEAKHEYIRGVKGSFNKTVNTIRQLKENNIDVSVCCVLTTDNVNEVSELSDFVRNELKVPLSIEIVRPNPRIKKVRPPKFEKRFLDLETTFFSEIQRKRMELKFDIINGKGKFNCLAGNAMGVIYSNGDVSICEMLKPFGNLEDTDYDFSLTWKKRPKRPQDCKCIHGSFISTSLYYDPKLMLYQRVKSLLSNRKKSL